ncbi:MAG: hypothetical protein COA79_10660 [Planctomycetota bacterium]|nr:MAG: hypothetical protein COA79_10660 [Planctomycetota bacterium]
MASYKLKEKILSSNFLDQLTQLKILQKRKSSVNDIGRLQSFHSGGHADFLEHRSYQKGDEPRLIDWNIYSRLNQFAVKVFSQQESSENHILIDSTSSMEFQNGSKALMACQLASAIAYLSLANDDAVKVSWANVSLHTGTFFKGKSAIMKLLLAISEISFGGTCKLEKGLQQISSTTKKGNIFIFSDFYQYDSLFPLISKMQNGRYNFFLFQILSNEELDFPNRGFFTLQDSETVEQEKIRINKSVQVEYKAKVKKFTDDIRLSAAKENCRFYQLCADNSFQEIIQILRNHHFFR